MLMSEIVKTEEVSFDLGGYVVRGIASGNKNATPLLCLHGWLDNAASFTPLLPYLQRYYVIAIDWPGHGHSDHRSHDAYYHFVDWTYDLLALFDVNKWQQIDIVAHSMGGMVASAFAAAFPEKVRSLTLLDSIGLLSTDAKQSTSQLRQGMLSRLKAKKKQKNIHSSLASAVTARTQVSDLKEEHAKLIVERGLHRDSDGYTWRSDSRLRLTSPYRLTLSQAEQFIRDITIPVQLIYGRDGMDMVTSGIEHFGPMFSSFKHHELIGGHHVHMEQAEKCAILISKFID